MAGERKPKHYDSSARHVVKLVANRPWLGWRHRRPIEQYTQARKRNALLQAGMNGGFMVLNLASGKFITIPFMALITYQMGRNYRRMSTNPAPFHEEWQPIRDALAKADEERAAGKFQRLPSPVTLAVLPLVGVAMALQSKLFLHASWSALLVGGIILGLLLDVGDIALHLRHAPKGAPVPSPVAATVVDLVAMEASPAPTPEFDGWDGVFPILDYDELTVSDIMPLLPQLYFDELPLVAERERAGKARRTILQRLAQLETILADAPEDVTAAEWAEMRPARKTAPAKRTASARA